MPNTFFGLTIATSGLYTSQAAINTTAHNTSNAKTEGYSRQQVKQTAMDALRVYQRYGTVGAGVEAVSIERVRDKYYDVKYWNNQARLGEHERKNYYSKQIENLFNDMNTDGYTKECSNLFDALEDLKGKPADLNVRNAFVHAAQSLAEYIGQISSDLTDLQLDSNTEISNQVDRVNTIAEELISLDLQIDTLEFKGDMANDLRDRRDLLLDELSEMIPITVTDEKGADGRNNFKVKIAGETLVEDYDHFRIQVVTREHLQNPEDAVGLYDIQWTYGDKIDGEELDAGSIKGLFQMRDGDNGDDVNYKGIPHYISKLDIFATEIANAFNSIIAKGEDLEGNSTANVPLFVARDGSAKITAYNLAVNPVLLQEPKKLGAVYDVEQGVDNNSLVDEMLNLRNAKLFQNGNHKEYLSSIITELSIDTKKAETAELNYTNIRLQITNQRQSISGVDKDEEAMDLVMYQEMYDLCSRIIQTMQELYNKLINETGV